MHPTDEYCERIKFLEDNFSFMEKGDLDIMFRGHDHEDMFGTFDKKSKKIDLYRDFKDGRIVFDGDKKYIVTLPPSSIYILDDEGSSVTLEKAKLPNREECFFSFPKEFRPENHFVSSQEDLDFFYSYPNRITPPRFSGRRLSFDLLCSSFKENLSFEERQKRNWFPYDIKLSF